MENSRRFIPGQNKNTAPSTPSTARRVLPTPPATETPAFRLAPGGNAVDSSHQLDTRPSTAQDKKQPAVAPLNIGRFKQNKSQKSGLRIDNRVTRSPSRPTKPLPQAAVQNGNPNEARNGRTSSIFGRQNGLLPPLTRQSSPTSPGLMAPPARLPNSRFSSPVSSIADNDAIENAVDKSLDDHQADPNDSEAHTSVSNLFGQTRVPADPDQHTSRVHPAAYRDDTRALSHEGDFDEPDVESPSPAAFSKRRAEDHHTHVPTKRSRGRYDSGGNDYPPQEQVQHESPAATQSQPLSQTAFSTSLDAYIQAHHDEWLAAQKRWENCTMDEWKNGPTELVAEFTKVMDMVKEFMIKRMEVYAGINKDVDAHKTRLDARDAMLAQEKQRLVKQAGGLAGSFVVN